MSFDSIQLVKCQVQNSENQISSRLIERSNFNLWRYLVTTKHHITIIKSSLCLWLSQLEFANKREIYERVGSFEPANRILVMTYDDHGNFNNTCRYALEKDTQDVEKILLSHVPEQQKQLQQFSHEIEFGQIVSKGPLVELNLATTSIEPIESIEPVTSGKAGDQDNK